MAYWNGVTNNGSDLSKLIGQLTASQEYLDRFKGKTNAEIVTTIYQSLFGRAPDAAGLDFFTKGLANGTLKLETLAINILDGAQGSDKSIIDNKTAAADLFTKSLDTQAEIDAYKGNGAADLGRAFLTKVTDDKTTIPSQTDVDKAVAGVVTPSGGQGPAGGGGGGAGPSGPNEPSTPANTYKVNEVVTPHKADGSLFSGGGNSADGFAITTNTATGIELGLSVRHRYGSVEETASSAGTSPVKFLNMDPENLAIAYSVSKSGGLNPDAYTYKLVLDGNPDTAFNASAATTSVFILQKDGEADYKWVLDYHRDNEITDADKVGGSFIQITDDATSTTAGYTQNIQPLASMMSRAGTYDIKLVAESGNTVISESAVQVVTNVTRSINDTVANTGNSELYVGQGNSPAKFATAEFDGVELGLGAKYSGKAPIDGTVGKVGSSVNDGLVHFKMSSDVASSARFEYSISSDKALLGAGGTGYKYELWIDNDKTSGKNYVKLELAIAGSGEYHTDTLNKENAIYVWKIKEDTSIPVSNGSIAVNAGTLFFHDDGGSAAGTVTQNIQSINWFGLTAGEYDVILQASDSNGR